MWTGQGLISSVAKNDPQHITTLGTVTGTQYLSTGRSTFDGLTIDSGDIVVKYTYYGDTDLNGTINFDDYSRIDAGFNAHATDWFNGDFDYNGHVDFDDYALIDLAFNEQGQTILAMQNYLNGASVSSSTMNRAELQKVKEHLLKFGDPYRQYLLGLT